MKIFLIIFSLISLISAKSQSQTPKNTESAKKEQGYVITISINGIDSGLAQLYNPQIKKMFNESSGKGGLNL